MSAMQTLLSERTRGIVSRDPSNGQEIGRAALMNAADVAVAVRNARIAQPAWAALPYRERAAVILRAREIVLARTDEIANLISRETASLRLKRSRWKWFLRWTS
jgi:acyl-CoA reductase-like NAD-dependent aldehyde dehydrogenase